jgi:hypothetical protein
VALGEVLGIQPPPQRGSLWSAVEQEVREDSVGGSARIKAQRDLRMRALALVQVDVAKRSIRNSAAVPIEHAHMVLLLGDRDALSCDAGMDSAGSVAIAAGEQAPLRCRTADDGQRLAAFKSLWTTQPVIDFPQAVITSARFSPSHVEVTPAGVTLPVDRKAAKDRVDAAVRAGAPKRASDNATGKALQDAMRFGRMLGLDGWGILNAIAGIIGVVGALVGFATAYVARRPTVATLVVGLLVSTVTLFAWVAIAYALATGPHGGVEPGMFAVVAGLYAAGQLAIAAAALGIFLASLLLGALAGARFSPHRKPTPLAASH